ncbi:MAG TPA: class II aldolase/adducin family protein [Spirochaetales bacterium]|nr:class II aldolase/adducin family protein [Spirochaetales bacterium]HRY54452.1 class II aldolase/adducin family protein [Spirochaetia bacterium]HRZ63755.1 class II aldolase/adducin family protein [Spirochaetia bacterium]
MSMTELEAKEAVRAAGVKLVEEDLVAGTWGNVSIRLGPSLMAITPTGTDYLSMKAEDIVLVDLETGEARGGKPSSEKDLHREIYRSRPEVNAVIHTHSMSASTVAAARREVPPILDDLAQIVGPSLRVADYALPGTGKMRRTALKGLRGRMAVLLANHGAVALGRSMGEALTCARIVEKGCRAFVEAEFLGGAKGINRFEARLMHEVYLRKYSRKSVPEGGEDAR